MRIVFQDIQNAFVLGAAIFRDRFLKVSVNMSHAYVMSQSAAFFTHTSSSDRASYDVSTQQTTPPVVELDKNFNRSGLTF